jgi:transposase
MMANELYVGADVSKARLDVHVIPSGDHWSVFNDDKGLKKLTLRLGRLGAALVVLEATGKLQVPFERREVARPARV